MGAIKSKYGKCSVCGADNVLLYRRHPAECKYCYQKGRQKVYQERAKERAKNGGKPKKKIKYIKPISDKQLKRLAEYRKVRDEYMAEHKYCEVHDCGKLATNLHHKAGRIGDLLTDKRYFMACCDTCHPRRIHETETAWAIKHGYLIKIHKKD